MVQLTRIYTKGGDKGKTSLGDGARVFKTDPRIDAIGAVDEVNTFIGLCRLYTTESQDIDTIFKQIQNDLFDIGADLCLPQTETEAEKTVLRIQPHQILYLETTLDSFNEKLSPLTSFILPGGSALAAHLHCARAMTRRAERAVCILNENTPCLNPMIIQYMNRLSDLLFVLSRVTNNFGKNDVLWVPGGK